MNRGSDAILADRQVEERMEGDAVDSINGRRKAMVSRVSLQEEAGKRERMTIQLDGIERFAGLPQ